MLVDPYFRFDQLSPLIPPKTELNKVLVSNRIKPEDKSALLQAIEDIQDGITIRIAKEGALHDRLAIGNSTVLQIGTSFNAVGKTSTTLINLDNTAEDMRREYENHWQEATDLTGDEL